MSLLSENKNQYGNLLRNRGKNKNKKNPEESWCIIEVNFNSVQKWPICEEQITCLGNDV